MFLNYYADMIPALFIFHLRARLYFCTGIKKRKDKHENSNTNHTRKKKPDARLAFRWAGGTALLSYSLVYALRKPFTAAEFEGLQVYGIDYKIAVSIIQLLGYVSAKLLGIKYISELKPEGRLKFIIGSAALSELSLIAFGLLPIP